VSGSGGWIWELGCSEFEERLIVSFENRKVKQRLKLWAPSSRATTAHLTTTPAPEEKCTRWVHFTHLGHSSGLSHQNRAPRLEFDPFAQTVLRNSAQFFSLSHHDEGHTQAHTRSFGHSVPSHRDLYQKIKPHRKAGTAFALDQSSITLNLKDVMRPLNRRSRTVIYSGVYR
jgi:hypothetical protein